MKLIYLKATAQSSDNENCSSKKIIDTAAHVYTISQERGVHFPWKLVWNLPLTAWQTFDNQWDGDASKAMLKQYAQLQYHGCEGWKGPRQYWQLGRIEENSLSHQYCTCHPFDSRQPSKHFEGLTVERYHQPLFCVASRQQVSNREESRIQTKVDPSSTQAQYYNIKHLADWDTEICMQARFEANRNGSGETRKYSDWM